MKVYYIKWTILHCPSTMNYSSIVIKNIMKMYEYFGKRLWMLAHLRDTVAVQGLSFLFSSNSTCSTNHVITFAHRERYMHSEKFLFSRTSCTFCLFHNLQSLYMQVVFLGFLLFYMQLFGVTFTCPSSCFIKII